MIAHHSNLLSDGKTTLTLLIEFQENSKPMLKVITIKNMSVDNLEEGTPILYNEYQGSTDACKQSKNFSLYKGNEAYELEGSHSKYKGKTLDEVKSLFSDSTIIASEYEL